jgi:3-hydroxyacyl-[acyl-carrier-protein] dehydratase
MEYDIKAAIPHREPFLLLDEITGIGGETLAAKTTLRPDDDLWSRIYAGHYPGSPITPGVLLCEMLFQAAAVLIHELAKNENLSGIPVVTRIQNAKFKTIVHPGDTVELEVALGERMANAFFLKGSVRRNGKTALQAEFAVALAPEGGTG